MVCSKVVFCHRTCSDFTLLHDFYPSVKQNVVFKTFSVFVVAGVISEYVWQFKYQDHIVENNLSDDGDICRELQDLITRFNIVICCFCHFSVHVKPMLVRSYCICLFDLSLWWKSLLNTIDKPKSCYIKYMKAFFGFAKYNAMCMLCEIGLLSVNTILHNYRISCKQNVMSSSNMLIRE